MLIAELVRRWLIVVLFLQCHWALWRYCWCHVCPSGKLVIHRCAVSQIMRDSERRAIFVFASCSLPRLASCLWLMCYCISVTASVIVIVGSMSHVLTKWRINS